MMKITEKHSANVCKLIMPKEMSDWIDERRDTRQYTIVQDGSKTGYAMKSRDCTVIVFPNWNCDSQFKNVVNKLR